MSELTTRPRELTQGVWEMIQSLAPTIHTSRLFKTAGPEQAAAIMLKGYELGLSMTAAFEFVHNIQGTTSISPRGALALIHQSPLCAGVKIEDKPGACTVTMKRTNGFEYSCTFTIEEAQAANLVKEGGAWQLYQANMLRWRAIGFCADVVFPDVLAGLKTADQFGAAISADGNVIEVEVL